MKINRHNSEEKNKITAMWLYEFAYDLEKNAQNIDYLKDYINSKNKNKKFDSIDEKLADFRERIGFDLAQKIVNEMEKSGGNIVEAGCGCHTKIDSCECSVKSASAHSDRDVKIMNNILKYIKDMVGHEPGLDIITVISRCKREDGLLFNEMEKKIDRDKLISYIKDLTDSKTEVELISYKPESIDTSLEDKYKDSVADYYNHAEPESR